MTITIPHLGNVYIAAKILFDSLGIDYVIKRNNPDINIAPLYGSGVFAYIGEYAKKIHASAIHPSFKTIIPDVIESCREHDIKINTWTIDDENDIIHARQMGIHGIITNVPDKALAVLKDK